MSDQLPDGVHLALAPKPYFKQKAMGSTCWTEIDRRGAGWWWKSEFNKHRRLPKKEPALTYGSALHVIILEGLAAYERTHVVEPSQSDFPDLADTIDEMREKLSEAGFAVPPKSRFDRQGWASQMLDLLPDHPCWHNILEEFGATAGDRVRVDSITDFELRFLREMAISPDRNDNEEVRRLLTESDEHPSLAEVSVFATIDGIRRRWRFDRFYPAAIMDLKSLAAWSGRPLEWEAGDVIAKRRWSIQRSDYGIHGRRELFKAVEEGRLYGGTLEQRRYLEQIVAEEEVECPFVWCVYQKPDSVKGIAPIFMPIWDEPPNKSELCQAGSAKLDKAIRTYKNQVAQWGLDTPWGQVERLHYTTERYGPGGKTLPRVFIPAYAFETADPADPGAYERET